jgi:hypothetical protein
VEFGQDLSRVSFAGNLRSNKWDFIVVLTLQNLFTVAVLCTFGDRVRPSLRDLNYFFGCPGAEAPG